MADSQYYDILFVGKTGSGKSFTGNKLLRQSEVHSASRPEDSIVRLWSSICSFLKGPPEHEPYDKKTFVTADDVDEEQRRLSVTGWCEVLANKETNVRILDVPGFSDSGAISKATGVNVGIFEANLQIFRWIVRVQDALKITTNLVVYFLPTRGALEKIDAVFRKELEVMYHFFGSAIFENMVVVATNHVRKQKFGFDDQDRRDTEAILHDALKLATGIQSIFCPPVVYIALADTGKEILDALVRAPVKSKKGLELKFREDVCAKCAVRTRYVSAPGSTKRTRVGVVYSNGTTKPYEDSMCHTKFVPRYTRAQKFWGGIAHVFTLGIGLAFKNHWPGWTNSDEMCGTCKCGPGSEGCQTVGEGKGVDHCNNL